MPSQRQGIDAKFDGPLGERVAEFGIGSGEMIGEDGEIGPLQFQGARPSQQEGDALRLLAGG